MAVNWKNRAAQLQRLLDDEQSRSHVLTNQVQAGRDVSNSLAGTINALRLKNSRAIRLLEAEAEYRKTIGNLKAEARLNADIAELNG